MSTEDSIRVEAQRAIVWLVMSWLNESAPADEFIARYWAERRRVLDIAYEGRFGEIMSAVDTAADAFSDDPDRLPDEIDEDAFRSEAASAMQMLRMELPEIASEFDR